MIGGSGITQSLLNDAERTMNWYPETAQSKDATSPRSLYPTPGFQPYAQVSDVGGRGSCNAGGRIFFVIGGTLVEVTGPSTVIVRGAVAQDNNLAQLVYGGRIAGQVAIASGGNLYVYVLATNTLTLVLSGLCTMVAFAAGFFFAFNINTGLVKLSKLNDATDFSAGNFIQRSLFPDPWQTMFTDANNLLWLIGTESFEVQYNTGVSNVPWAPLSGLNGFYGIAAPFAFASSALGNFWIASNKHGLGQLVFSTGSIPTPIASYAYSTAVGKFLQQSTIADAEVLAYQQLGHTFVVVRFPRPQSTWVYDVTEQTMSERGQFNPMTGAFGLWTPRVHQPAFGVHLVAGMGNTICSMDPSFTTEFDGQTGIVRERTTPVMTHEHKRVPIDQIELLTDTGVTTAQTGQGANPVMTLRVSVDGGYTFGNERQASLGAIGQRFKRVYWSQLGAPSSIVVRVRSTDPAPSRIIDAYVNNAEP